MPHTGTVGRRHLPLCYLDVQIGSGGLISISAKNLKHEGYVVSLMCVWYKYVYVKLVCILVYMNMIDTKLLII